MGGLRTTDRVPPPTCPTARRAVPTSTMSRVLRLGQRRAAVAIRCRLAEANPDAYLPNLAMSLNNLSIRLLTRPPGGGANSSGRGSRNPIEIKLTVLVVPATGSIAADLPADPLIRVGLALQNLRTYALRIWNPPRLE